jgi:hypothetical protein
LPSCSMSPGPADATSLCSRARRSSSIFKIAAVSLGVRAASTTFVAFSSGTRSALSFSTSLRCAGDRGEHLRVRLCVQRLNLLTDGLHLVRTGTLLGQGRGRCQKGSEHERRRRVREREELVHLGEPPMHAMIDG